MKRILIGLLLAGAVLPASGYAQTAEPGQGQIVATIRTAQHMDCGTVETTDDWSYQTVHGDLSAIEGEICRAVAVAILGSEQGLTVHGFPAELDTMNALKAGSIQLAVGLSPSATTAAMYGAAFGPAIYYDTERLLVAKSSGIKSLEGLRDQVICAMNLSDPQRVLSEEMAARHIPFGLQAHSEVGEMAISVAVRRCTAGAAMESWLADARANFPAAAPEFVFLPDRIGLDPVVPAYRYGDQTFSLIVGYTISALIEAEALGITQANVEESKKRQDLRAERLLGRDIAMAQALGLSRDWVAKVIATTGNYGEIFDRTIGKPLRLERGLNALWTQGGLMRPLPMQ